MISTPHALALAALAALAWAACVERGPAPHPHAPPSFAHAEHPPFELTLDGASDTDETSLVARIVLHDPLPAPLELTLTLPDGASLASGAAFERVTAPPRGRTLTRAFRVRGADARPIRLTAHQQAGEVAGARATRTWPPPSATGTAPPPRWAPSPAPHHGRVPLGGAVVLPSPGAP